MFLNVSIWTLQTLAVARRAFWKSKSLKPDDVCAILDVPTAIHCQSGSYHLAVSFAVSSKSLSFFQVGACLTALAPPVKPPDVGIPRTVDLDIGNDGNSLQKSRPPHLVQIVRHVQVMSEQDRALLRDAVSKVFTGKGIERPWFDTQCTLSMYSHNFLQFERAHWTSWISGYRNRWLLRGSGPGWQLISHERSSNHP